MSVSDTRFPFSMYTSLFSLLCISLTARSVIGVPLPTNRLASAAMRALQVDAELSPLVQRHFAVTAPESDRNGVQNSGHLNRAGVEEGARPILRTEYKATTNRMLRVAVNGFMESLGVVLGVMEELDLDVLSTAAQPSHID
jgi:EKC/KEOPS complex subunit PCC1/LAGE3